MKKKQKQNRYIKEWNSTYKGITNLIYFTLLLVIKGSERLIHAVTAMNLKSFFLIKEVISMRGERVKISMRGE